MIVCAQNVSGMVSTGSKEPVIGVHGVRSHPPPTPTQPKPDVCTCSHSPFSRHSLQPGQIWSNEGADQAGGAACGERGEQARGQRLSEIDGGREEFGGKLLGPINPSELCFPESE